MTATNTLVHAPSKLRRQAFSPRVSRLAVQSKNMNASLLFTFAASIYIVAGHLDIEIF
jgi:hypothetical protein